MLQRRVERLSRNMKQQTLYTLLFLSTIVTHSMLCTAAAGSAAGGRDILVLGSVNMDITVDVERLPLKGETTTSRTHTVSLAVGGKGANQAVAAARLSNAKGVDSSSGSSSRRVRFISRFGNDSYAFVLRQELSGAGVDVSGCVAVPYLGSGLGLVMLEPDGAASSVVVGGANTAWTEGEVLSPELLSGVGVLLLQREVPEHVNLAAAQAAAAAGVPVLLDAGGSDRPIPAGLLRLVSFLCPNELELQALTGNETHTQQQVVAAARSLISAGVSSVLVTLSERGAVLVAADGSVLTQPALPVPGGTVVDGTAAGDAFRAAFAVGLVRGWPLQQCMQLAAAAGALAVSRKGALPSLPTLDEVRAHLQANAESVLPQLLTDLDAMTRLEGQSCGAATAEGSCSSTEAPSTPPPAAGAAWAAGAAGQPCPLKFASRLNSMQARRDLVPLAGAASSNDVLGWIARQGLVVGLSLVDLNYPQHFEGLTTEQITSSLQKAGLGVGAINIRFPPKFFQGAFSNPDPHLRAAAVQLAVDGCNTAAILGAAHVIVWSPYDGYDFHMQVDYDTAWQHTVTAYQQLLDKCPPDVRVSLEFKPTDPSTRFSIVPTTAAALLLMLEVARPNFGLTLDIGHLLMAGENPAQSVAMVARFGKLFGLHLNDAHVKLGAEDGLPFGSVNPMMALEVVLQLQKARYSGHVYFDTFPTTMDPVKEAELNILVFKALWERAAQLSGQLAELSSRHDALGLLQLLHMHSLQLLLQQDSLQLLLQQQSLQLLLQQQSLQLLLQQHGLQLEGAEALLGQQHEPGGHGDGTQTQA